MTDAATAANPADPVRASGPSLPKSVERLVAEGMSRLSAERAVAIREGAAEPSRARRHGRSGL